MDRVGGRVQGSVVRGQTSSAGPLARRETSITGPLSGHRPKVGRERVVIASPLARRERVRVRAFSIRLRHLLSIRSIDAAVAKTAFERLQIVGKLALDPFEIGQTRAISELVEHPCWDQVGNVLLRYSLFASNAHKKPRRNGVKKVNEKGTPFPRRHS
jgi:hypothetical protein